VTTILPLHVVARNVPRRPVQPAGASTMIVESPAARSSAASCVGPARRARSSLRMSPTDNTHALPFGTRLPVAVVVVVRVVEAIVP
jgi:hypothetical protein